MKSLVSSVWLRGCGSFCRGRDVYDPTSLFNKIGLRVPRDFVLGLEPPL